MKYYYAPRIEADGGATEIDNAQVVLAEDYDRLREALSWYADESLYDNGEAWRDGGDKARAALQEAEG